MSSRRLTEGSSPGRAAGDGQAEFVHALLTHFDRVGWPGAPRLSGVGVDGRPVLTRPEGYVAREPAQPPAVWSVTGLARVARLVRQCHDLTAGTGLAGGWEVVCHNDLAPYNTVYRFDGESFLPHAFVGWDHASPGYRVDDVAHMCWTFLALGPKRSAPTAFGGLMRAVCDAYGLDPVRRSTVVDTMIARLGRYAGNADEARRTVAWIEAGRPELDAALR